MWEIIWAAMQEFVAEAEHRIEYRIQKERKKVTAIVLCRRRACMPSTDLKENVVWKSSFGCSSISLASGILVKLQLATAYTQTSEKSSFRYSHS